MNNLVNPAFMNFIYGAADQTPQIWDQWGDGEWDDEPTINYQRQQDEYHKQQLPYSSSKTETSSSCNNPSFKFPINDGRCPQCGEKLILKAGKFGDFYSCPNFPDCRYHCSTKQFEAALKYNKREEKSTVVEPKKENSTIAEVKIEFKSNPSTPCQSKVEVHDDIIYTNYLDMICGECALYSHSDNKCLYREWCDLDKNRPACEMFISNDKDERLATLEFLKSLRQRKRNESK